MSFFEPDPIPTTAFGEVQTAENTTKINLRFDYKINKRQVNTVVVGSGSVGHSGRLATPTTGTTAGSTASISSRRLLKYNNGQGLDVRLACLFGAPAAGCGMAVGLGSRTDGWAWGYNGTDFGRYRFKGGVVDFQPSTNFSTDKLDSSGPSGMTIVQTNINVFKITAQYLGGGSQTFYVESSVNNIGVFQEADVINYANQNTDTSINNPSLPVFAEVWNGVTTNDITMSCSSFSGAVQGLENFIGVRNGQFGSQVSIGVTLTNILTINNRATYSGIANRVPCLMDYLAVSSDGPKNATFGIYLNATVAGAVFNPQDPVDDDSVIEYSTTAGAVTGGKLILPIPIGKATNASAELPKDGIDFYPGESLTIAGIAQSGGSGNDLVAGASWLEQF